MHWPCCFKTHLADCDGAFTRRSFLHMTLLKKSARPSCPKTSAGPLLHCLLANRLYSSVLQYIHLGLPSEGRNRLGSPTCRIAATASNNIPATISQQKAIHNAQSAGDLKFQVFVRHTVCLLRIDSSMLRIRPTKLEIKSSNLPTNFRPSSITTQLMQTHSIDVLLKPRRFY